MEDSVIFSFIFQNVTISLEVAKSKNLYSKLTCYCVGTLNLKVQIFLQFQKLKKFSLIISFPLSLFFSP